MEKSNRASQSLRILCESAIMVALATVLSMIKVYPAPYGGSVTILSMAPIIVLSMRRGVKTGLFAAFAYSLIQLLLGISDVMWVPTAGGIALCVLLDYILAFTVLGLGGLFRKVRFTQNDTANLILAAFLGTLLATALRYLCHIISGVVIWYALDLEWYADEPSHIVNRYGPWMFSLLYNGAYMVPEIVETCIGVPLLSKALSKVK